MKWNYKDSWLIHAAEVAPMVAGAGETHTW